MAGRIYSIVFTDIAVSAAQDLFEIATPAATGVNLLGLMVGQSSDYGDAQAEGARVLVIRGATTTGSGGASVTPVQMMPGTGASVCTCKRNNTTAATGGTPVQVHNDAFNIQSGYQFWWTPETTPRVAPSSRIVVNLPAAPTDAIQMSATLIFEETS
jgi:hypothetical protein